MEPTIDPGVVILERGPESIHYRFLPESGREGEWVIDGTCIRCGDCEVGNDSPSIEWTGIPLGEPGAVYDHRYDQPNPLDNPVLPEGPNELWPHCSLRGRWL